MFGMSTEKFGIINPNLLLFLRLTFLVGFGRHACDFLKCCIENGLGVEPTFKTQTHQGNMGVGRIHYQLLEMFYSLSVDVFIVILAYVFID